MIKRDNDGNPVYKPIHFCFGNGSVYIYTGNTNETRKNTYTFEKYYDYLIKYLLTFSMLYEITNEEKELL